MTEGYGEICLNPKEARETIYAKDKRIAELEGALRDVVNWATGEHEDASAVDRAEAVLGKAVRARGSK